MAKIRRRIQKFHHEEKKDMKIPEFMSSRYDFPNQELRKAGKEHSETSRSAVSQRRSAPELKNKLMREPGSKNKPRFRITVRRPADISDTDILCFDAGDEAG